MAKELSVSQNVRVSPTIDMSMLYPPAYDSRYSKVILNDKKLSGFVSDHKIVMKDDLVIVRLQATSSHIGDILEMVGKTDVNLTLRVHAGGDSSNYHDFNYKVKVEKVYPESLGGYVPVICVVLRKMLGLYE